MLFLRQTQQMLPSGRAFHSPKSFTAMLVCVCECVCVYIYICVYVYVYVDNNNNTSAIRRGVSFAQVFYRHAGVCVHVCVGVYMYIYMYM